MSAEQTLREFAAFLRRDMGPAWGGDLPWLTSGSKVADLIASIAEDHAQVAETYAPAEHGDTPDLTKQIADLLARHELMSRYDSADGKIRDYCVFPGCVATFDGRDFHGNERAHHAAEIVSLLSARSAATPDTAAQAQPMSVRYGLALDGAPTVMQWDDLALARLRADGFSKRHPNMSAEVTVITTTRLDPGTRDQADQGGRA